MDCRTVHGVAQSRTLLSDFHFHFSCYAQFSVVSNSETPGTTARQASLSMGTLQVGTLEWVAMPFSRESSRPRDRTQVSVLRANSLPSEPPGKSSSRLHKSK